MPDLHKLVLSTIYYYKNYFFYFTFTIYGVNNPHTQYSKNITIAACIGVGFILSTIIGIFILLCIFKILNFTSKIMFF